MQRTSLIGGIGYGAVLVTLAASVACGSTKGICTSDGDCPAEQRCDTEFRLCVRREGWVDPLSLYPDGGEDAGSKLSITPQTFPPAQFGTPYQQTLTATEGAPPYTWSLTAVPPALPWLWLEGTTGVLSGTPTKLAAETEFEVKVTDSVGTIALASFKLAVEAGDSCTPGEPCRLADSVCDVPEICTEKRECPPNKFEPNTKVCAAESCKEGAYSAPSLCSGTSAACARPTVISCNGFVCAGAVCARSCKSDADCLSTHFCHPTTNTCQPKRDDGQSCTSPKLPEECSSGICAASYLDEDGDGYGTGSVAYTCGKAIPKGRVSNNSDCCDSDRNAYPGQTAYFDSPRAGCGGFDFNCANGDEPQWAVGNACSAAVVCSTILLRCSGSNGWESAVPTCGAAGIMVSNCGTVRATCDELTVCRACTTCLGTRTRQSQSCH